MEAEINRLRNAIDNTKKDKGSWISQALDTLANEATGILSSGALAGIGLALMSLIK